MRHRTVIWMIGLTLLTGCVGNTSLPTLLPTDDLAADEIMRRAHDAAGGEQWRRPRSLSMTGYAVFYRDGKAVRHEQHSMWRVYARDKQEAHVADGKVRIESMRDGNAIIDLSFDGTTTYTAAGPQPQSAADQQWSSSFGFGVIRHALDAGYTLARLPDDLIDGRPAYVINVLDPTGGATRFGIAHDDLSILRVGFDTPRGWHERIYSEFFSNPGSSWRQPGRVRLYYDGIKANEVIWTRYALDRDLPDCLFVLPEAADCQREP
ncbi:MAG: hypothetical protein AAF290_13470 [Pseudomonadota bacterium]